MPGILIANDSSIRLLLRSFVETKTKFTVCGEAERHGCHRKSTTASTGFGFTRSFHATVEQNHGGQTGRPHVWGLALVSNLVLKG